MKTGTRKTWTEKSDEYSPPELTNSLLIVQENNRIQGAMYNNSKTFYVTFFILNENLQRHHLSNGSDGTYCIVYPHVASLRGVCFVE